MLRVTCPSCGAQVEASNARYVACSPSLVGDPVLGPEAALRFRPTRFDAGGTPIDPEGAPTTTPACPVCRAAWPDSIWRTTCKRATDA